MSDRDVAYDPTIRTPGASGAQSAVGVLRERHASLGEEFVGKVLGDRYLLREIVGAGGFGAVFASEDQRIKKKVAVKLLFADMLRDHEAVIRFKLEAEAASQVGHQNIIDITDFDFTEDGTAYMVMEFLDGEDLAHIIRRAEKPNLSRSVRLCLQACRGLGAAHRKGIVHRDLKPGNIFVCRREGAPESVKVVDFGISRASELDHSEERLTKTGQILGTPYYMAPEQADGIREVDGRADIYAMGVILYEACTGDLPFMARTPIGLITKHATELPRPPSERNDAIPVLLQNTILKALEKDPADRFASMAELEQALLGSLATIDPTAAAVEVASMSSGFDSGDNRIISEEALIALTTPSSVLQRTAHTQATSPKRRPWAILGVAAGVAVVGVAVLLTVKLGGGGKKPSAQTQRRIVSVTTTDREGMGRLPPMVMERVVPMRIMSTVAMTMAEAMERTPPVAPTTVKLTCRVQPASAKVYGPDRQLLGVCKDGIFLKRGNQQVELRLYQLGYHQRFVKVVPDRDKVLGPLWLAPAKTGSGGGLPDDPMKW